jgi:hypothetical protein
MSLTGRKSSLAPPATTDTYFSRGQQRDDVDTATNTQLVAAVRSRRVIKRPVPVLQPRPGKLGPVIKTSEVPVTTLYVVSGYVDPDYVE